jgi:hypothetical protein
VVEGDKMKKHRGRKKGDKIKKEFIGLLRQSLDLHAVLNEWQEEDGGPDLVGIPVAITVKPYKLRWL